MFGRTRVLRERAGMAPNATGPIANCPKLPEMGKAARTAAIEAGTVGQTACTGANIVRYYDNDRRSGDGRLIPEDRFFCCQDPVLLEVPPRQVIYQEVTGRGQLAITVARNDIGDDIFVVGRTLDPSDPIPSTTVVLGPDGEQLHGIIGDSPPPQATPLQETA